MEVLYFLVPISLLLALVGLVGFFWASENGQFDDLQQPAEAILRDEMESRVEEKRS